MRRRAVPGLSWPGAAGPLARRNASDEDGAQAAVRIVRQDDAARRAAGRKDQFQYRTGAMIAMPETCEGVEEQLVL